MCNNSYCGSIFNAIWDMKILNVDGLICTSIFSNREREFKHLFRSLEQDSKSELKSQDPYSNQFLNVTK